MYLQIELKILSFSQTFYILFTFELLIEQTWIMLSFCKKMLCHTMSWSQIKRAPSIILDLNCELDIIVKFFLPNVIQHFLSQCLINSKMSEYERIPSSNDNTARTRHCKDQSDARTKQTKFTTVFHYISDKQMGLEINWIITFYVTSQMSQRNNRKCPTQMAKKMK